MPGHQKEIFINGKKLHERLHCVICKLVLKKAVQSTCGHRFCESCVKEKLQNSSENGSIPRCPACPAQDSEESVFKEDQIYPDFHARKELKNLNVKCINEGCQWTGTFNKYSSEHEGQCEFESIKCLKAGCGKTLRRAELAYHLEKDCPMRRVRCRHCGDETVFKNMKKHNAECLKTPVTCRDCGEKMIRELLQSHQDVRSGTCPRRSRQCPFVTLGCTFKVSAGGDAGLNEHLQTEILYHTKLQIEKVEEMLEQGKLWLQSQSAISQLHTEISTSEGESAAETEEGACAEPKARTSKLSSEQLNQLIPMFQQMFVTRAEQNGDTARNSGKSISSVDKESVDRRISELESKVRTGEEELNKMRTLYAVLDKRNETFQEVVAVLNNQLEVVVEKTNALERENRHLHDTIDQQEKQIHAHDQMLTVKNVALAEQELRIQTLEASSYNGILVWKITDFARRRSEAVSGKTTSFYSQPFYTSYHGYKMRARIYLNGDGMGKGTHLSLFFVVMKGRYDNILRWPFRQKVTFMMVDQGNREHVVDSFRPDPTSSSFKYPTHEMNIASGCPMFLKLDLMDSDNHQYIKDDCLFVKVIVDVSDLERM